MAARVAASPVISPYLCQRWQMSKCPPHRAVAQQRKVEWRMLLLPCFVPVCFFSFFFFLLWILDKKKVLGCVAMATPDEALLDCGSVSRSKPPCKQRMLAACKPCLPTSCVSVGLLQGCFSRFSYFSSYSFFSPRKSQISHPNNTLFFPIVEGKSIQHRGLC